MKLFSGLALKFLLVINKTESLNIILSFIFLNFDYRGMINLILCPGWFLVKLLSFIQFNLRDFRAVLYIAWEEGTYRLS